MTEPSALALATTTISTLGERDVVDRITRALARPDWVLVGPGDDAAVIAQIPRRVEVLTTDTLVDGVHMDRRFTTPEAIGHRALAVNLSDLAAMGARPRAALLSLALPADLPVDDLEAMMRGLTALADRARIAVVGGNVTSISGPLVVTLAVTGSAHPRRVLRRGGARPGDDVYVTGSLGAAMVGLWSLQSSPAQPPRAGFPPTDVLSGARERYLRPLPRVATGVGLADYKAASACIDLSDGLADGVQRVAEASGVGIALFADELPIHPSVTAWFGGDAAAARTAALRGGDDYELLFTASPRNRGRLRAVGRLAAELPITRIGTVTRSRSIVVRTADGEESLPAGFAHFG